MAITLTTTPDANVAAFAPVLIAGTSSRNPFLTSGVRDSRAVGGYSNASGKVQLSVGSQSWEVGDTVLIEDDANEIYNGRHEIYAVTSTTITLNTSYTAAGSGGTIYRMNEGLNIKIEIENSSSEVIATRYSNINTSDGSWSLDLSRSLQYELSGLLDLTEGETETATFSHSYTIVIYESFLADDYTVTEFAHGTEPTTIAHRTVELKTDFVNGLKLMTGDFFHNGLIPIHFLMNTGGAGVELKFTEADGTVTATGALTETRWHYAYTFASESSYVKVAAYDVVEGTRLTEEIYIRKIGCNSTLIWFLNRYGAYLAYEIHNYDADQKTKKIDKYTGESWQERK